MRIDLRGIRPLEEFFERNWPVDISSAVFFQQPDRRLIGGHGGMIPRRIVVGKRDECPKPRAKSSPSRGLEIHLLLQHIHAIDRDLDDVPDLIHLLRAPADESATRGVVREKIPL